MAGATTDTALTRIEAALSRIEAAAVASSRSQAELAARHERLREAVTRSVEQLDGLLEGQSA